jgi:hypothetical protein
MKAIHQSAIKYLTYIAKDTFKCMITIGQVLYPYLLKSQLKGGFLAFSA